MKLGGQHSPLGPTVAGTWYPADAETLAAEVDGLIAGAAPTGAAEVVALIAPHAGFAYSGAVAAHGFGRIRGAEFERVLLLGPSHYAAFRGAAVPPAPCYRTPLGEVPIDVDAVLLLSEDPAFRLDPAPFLREHSLEAELPFLQRALAPDWRLVPVLIGSGTRDDVAQQVADALRPLLDRRTLVVVSSDFTHYGPRFDYVPFDDDVPARIRKLDMGAIDRIVQQDLEAFDEYVTRTGATICGRDAIGVWLRMAPGGLQAGVASYDTSGRITGDWIHSVSYAAVVFDRLGSAVR